MHFALLLPTLPHVQDLIHADAGMTEATSAVMRTRRHAFGAWWTQFKSYWH